jgi:Acetyltransferase (GNAT) domain
MAENTVEISVKGKWFRVPALAINGNTLIVRGKWIRKAVVHDEQWLTSDIEAPELCLQALKEERSPELRADIFTFAQKLPTTLPKYEYPMEWDSTAAIRLTSFKDWWENLPQETRKNVRRSQKRGLVVGVKELDEDLIRGIADVNNDSPMRQRVPHAHYGKSFDQVKKDQSSFLDRSEFICAYLGNELIGFLKLVYRGNIASILQLLAKPSHQDKRPSNALIAKAVEICEARGMSYLIFGLFNYGHKRDSPLREFKVRNGFEEVLTPRFYIPLTLWGKVCMELGLHRGLIGILPHNVILLGVNARARWYNFRQSTSRCSSMVEQPNSLRQTGRSNPPAGSNSYPQ